MSNKRVALVIGIDDYPKGPLAECVNDAEELAGVLEMKEYSFSVSRLYNHEATRRNTISALQSELMADADFVLVYFSGHGVTSPVGTYLATVDSDDIEPGIDLDILRRYIISASDSTTVFVVLDCCHSGSANVRNTPGIQARKASNQDINQAIPNLGSGKVLMAACQSHELAYEKPSLRHGVFTYFLLQGLYGEAADSEGRITVPALYDFVSKKFEGTIGQIPVFKGDIIGRLVVGVGLTPRDRLYLPEEKLREIEVTAQNLMNQYIQETSTDIETWKTSTYREACRSLLPKLRWFDSQIAKYPSVTSRSQFKSAHAAAQAKLADLGNLMEETNTLVGVVKSKLGSGTFGTVWYIKSDNGQDLAYKVYHPIDLGNKEKLSRFDRGYRAMAQLDHPNIVKVHTVTEAPIGFIMDFIPGSNLRNYAPTRPEPNEIAAQLLIVAETLKHSHSKGVIHRDVKPENIIMRWDESSQTYRPYLTDFDLAWFSTATQFTREALGSLIYAAPEQLGKPNSSVAHAATTDVYAFGQLCFFFICRRDPVPFLADNLRALQQELRTWNFEEPARKMSELYDCCTKQNPSERFNDFRDICDLLYEISQLLNETDHTKIIDFDTFFKQLAFSIAGFPELVTSNNSFYTTSGQVAVTVSVSKGNSAKANFQFVLNTQIPPTREGLSHEDVRRDINQRIDEVLKSYPQARRRSGKQGPFETFINVNEISMNIDGVEICRQILTRAIDCIERI